MGVPSFDIRADMEHGNSRCVITSTAQHPNVISVLSLVRFYSELELCLWHCSGLLLRPLCRKLHGRRFDFRSSNHLPSVCGLCRAVSCGCERAPACIRGRLVSCSVWNRAQLHLLCTRPRSMWLSLARNEVGHRLLDDTSAKPSCDCVHLPWKGNAAVTICSTP